MSFTNSAIAGIRSWLSAIPPLKVILLEPHEIVVSLARGRHGEAVSVDQHFHAAWASVVVGRHHVTVRADITDSEEVAGVCFVHRPVERQEIATLADRADDVHRYLPLDRLHRLDAMVRIVVRRTKQLGHASVGDEELAPTAVLP